MAIKFQEIKKYIARNVRVSICFEDGYYHDYLMIGDIPEGKYDDLYVYGIGMADVEFSKDIYTMPPQLEGIILSTKDDRLEPAIEIVLYENPREIERSEDRYLMFKDLKPYLQIGRNFSVVDRKDWSYETYEWKKDIPAEYDNMYVYGVGMEDNPNIDERLRNTEYDITLKKRMVLVLADEPREEIQETKSASTNVDGPYFLLITADEWDHDADEWIGIYTDKKKAREAYDRAVVAYEKRKNKGWYSEPQRVSMKKFISEEEGFREVKREELETCIDEVKKNVRIASFYGINVYCDLNFAKGAYIDLEYVGGGENDYSWIRMNIEDGSIHTTYNCIRYLKHTLQEWYKDNRKYLMEIYRTRKLIDIPNWEE